MKMHAYLIMAHTDFYILEKLLILLDDERNDLYIHIDRKIKDFDFDYYTSLIHKSKIVFIDRIKVEWGGYSIVQCELNLMKEALKKEYHYFHLLSGADMPLKSQDDIHNFFDKKEKEQFCFIDYHACETANFSYKIRYYFFFRDMIGKTANKSKWYQLLDRLEWKLIRAQKKLKVNRRRKDPIKYYKGSQWVCLTKEAVQELVNKEKMIRRKFRFTNCADEIFIQTILMNSEFAHDLINSDLRLINWSRGKPYTYQSDDYRELMNSDCLWARKFDTKVDKQIIDKIYNTLVRKSEDHQKGEREDYDKHSGTNGQI